MSNKTPSNNGYDTSSHRVVVLCLPSSRFIRRLLILLLLSSAHAEIKEYDFSLTASSNFVHYYSGYLVSPGTIDLGRVQLKSSMGGLDNTRRARHTYIHQRRRRALKKNRRKDDDDGDDDDDDDDDDDEVVDDDKVKSTLEDLGIDLDEDDDDKVNGDDTVETFIQSLDKNSTDAQTPSTHGDETNHDTSTSDPSSSSTTTKDSSSTESQANTSTQVFVTQKVHTTTVDIVLFHEPSTCSRQRNGCDWTKLGIGKKDTFGSVRWCCSEATAILGFCNATSSSLEFGRMIIDESIFQGQRRIIHIPSTEDSSSFSISIPNPVMDVKEQSGKYILAFGNCNDYGRDVSIVGTQEWKSSYGYLPGDLIDLWYFFMILMIVYIALFLWYGVSMRIYKDSSIGIQSYILGTIGLSALEMICRSTDYILWNQSGLRSYPAVFVWISIGVLKDAISRCLVLMVALGWGVIRDTLSQLKKVIFLGFLYSIFSLAQEIAGVLFVKDLYTTDLHHEERLYDMYRILDFVVQLINVVFYYWILYALTGTMQYLSNMGQTRKLGRYLRFRCILLLSLLLAIVTVLFGVAETNDIAVVPDNFVWIYDALWEFNYAIILFAISVLWRPNPSAREYAVAMEIPIGGDIEFDASIGRGFHDDDDDDDLYDEDNKTAPTQNRSGRTKLELS